MPENTETNVQETPSSVTEDMIPDFDIEIGDVELTRNRVLATLRALFMVATTVFSMIGFEFNLDAVYQIILVVLMAASMIWNYWKNNNWTKNAVKAQKVLDNMSK